MSLSKEERKAIVEFRIEKAIRAFNEAKGVIKLGYWETIANRLYYAAYNAVSALLIANGDTAQTHSGVIHLFGLRFIKTGVLSSDMGKLFHSLFTMRQTGDYDDWKVVTEADIMPLVSTVEVFLDTLEGVIRKDGYLN